MQQLETVECKRNRLQVDAVYIVRTSNGFIDKIKEELVQGEWCRLVHLLAENTVTVTKDTYHGILKHSVEADYNNILILDDTCFLNTTINDKAFNDVNDCLNKHRSERYVYYLGCLPLAMLPIGQNNYRVCAVNGYASIYSKAFIASALQHTSSDDCDMFRLLHAPCYTYTFPFCYSNSKTADLYCSQFDFKTLVRFAQFVVQTVSFDRQHVNGYKLCYFLAKHIFFVFLILVLFILLLIFYRKSIYTKSCPLLKSVCSRIKRKALTVFAAFRSAGTSTHPLETVTLSPL